MNILKWLKSFVVKEKQVIETKKYLFQDVEFSKEFEEKFKGKIPKDAEGGIFADGAVATLKVDGQGSFEIITTLMSIVKLDENTSSIEFYEPFLDVEGKYKALGTLELSTILYNKDTRYVTYDLQMNFKNAMLSSPNVISFDHNGFSLELNKRVLSA